MSGKGSAPRPFSVSNEEYASRWDAIFGRDKKEEPPCKHEVWTHDGETYRCLECGIPGEAPYLSR